MLLCKDKNGIRKKYENIFKDFTYLEMRIRVFYLKIIV